VLKQAGLVSDLKEGTRRVYQVKPEGIDALRKYFEQLWTRNLNAFKTAADKAAERKINDSSRGNRTRKKVI